MDEKFDNLLKQRFETREVFEPSDVRGSASGYTVVPPPPPVVPTDAEPQTETSNTNELDILDEFGEYIGNVGATIGDLPDMVIRGILNAGGEAAYSAGIIDKDQADVWRKMLKSSGKMAEKEGVNPVARGLGEGLAQFGAGMIGPFKALRAVGVARPLAALVAEGLSGAFAFNPDDPNFGNFINSFEPENPIVKNIADYIQTDPNDTEAENRFRNLVQDVVPSAVVESIVKGVKTVREMDPNTIIEAGEAAEKRLSDAMSGTTLSANPVGAVGDAAIAGAGKVAKVLKSDPIDDAEIPTLREVLKTKAKEMELKPDKRTQPSGEQMFDVTPESYANGVMPEAQIETPVPRAPVGAKLPKKERSKGIVDNMEQIADILAERARPHVGTNVQYFYHLGPLVTKAQELGISTKEAMASIKDFAFKYAATSPRTQTEPNLRSASLVRAKESQGINYDKIVGPGGSGINEVGFPMMINEKQPGKGAGIHKILLDALKNDGKIDYRTNPKPATFAENVSGNLNGVTVDTHAIRGALHVLNEVAPGSIPRQWFGSDAAYKAYLKDPTNTSHYSGKDLADTLDGQVVDGKKQQTEYAVFSDLYKMVADRLGVLPAEAQSLSWFANGNFTGLGSAPKSIVELINERVDVTAQALNKSKDAIFKGFLQGKIPLMSGAGLLIGGGMMEDENDN